MFALALLHPAVQLGSAFTVHWSTVIGLLALLALYEWRARVHARRPQPARYAAVVTALGVLFLTLNGPLHDLSDYYLFSGHMVQHLIMTFVVPPLLLWGTPGWMLRPALEVGWVRALARPLSSGRGAYLAFNVTLAVWHLPPLYNAAMYWHQVHIVQHLTFLVASTLMWWPLMGSLPELPRLPYPGQLLYSFLMTIPMSITAIYIALADHVLYPAYASAPRLWGLSPMEDQQLGGLIMWVPGGLFFLVVMSIVFFRWMEAGATDGEAAAQPALRTAEGR